MAIFFFVFMLIMICVCSSRDPRSYVQNGFWIFKWIAFIAIIVGFFFIPITDNFLFSYICLVIGMIGAFLFIFLQVCEPYSCFFKRLNFFKTIIYIPGVVLG